MLYIFASRPPQEVLARGQLRLHAGGIQFGTCACNDCFIGRGNQEAPEPLVILNHDSAIEYRKEGVFIKVGGNEEYLGPVEYHISDLCFRDGITWDWFNQNWGFGNGIVAHKTHASPTYKTVIHGTDWSLDEYLTFMGRTRFADLELERKHIRHESWQAYERRWVPGTCPQESHLVNLTWLVTDYKLPDFAYGRLRELIEEPNSQPLHPECYSQEPGKHFSTIRQWDGKPAFAGARR